VGRDENGQNGCVALSYKIEFKVKGSERDKD